MMSTNQLHPVPIDLALTLSDTSPFFTDPARLPSVHPELQGLTHVKAVGTGLMSNEHVYRLEDGERAATVLDILKKEGGVFNVVLLEKKKRVKRDEF
jgi:hypothetical protein